MASCTCKEKTLYGYEKELFRLNVWPLERAAQKSSMGEILSILDEFRYEVGEPSCQRSCQQNFRSIILNAQMHTSEYFEGLCLDCMDHSKSKTEDVDMDYWQHSKLHESEWVRGCRFSHKQPTWYYSFMGRKETRDRLREKARALRRY